MTTEEQILASIEEIGTKLEELKKLSKNVPSNNSIDLSGIEKSLIAIDAKLITQKKDKFEEAGENNRISYELKNLNDLYLQISSTITRERQQIVHKYIELTKPIRWVVLIFSYFLISLTCIYYLMHLNSQLDDKLNDAKANDLKYRFMRVSDQKIPEKIIKTTSDLVYNIDDYYKKNQKEIEKYVVQKEEDIQRAIEAQELARQRNLEAKKAQEEAEKLQQKVDSNNK